MLNNYWTKRNKIFQYRLKKKFKFIFYTSKIMRCDQNGKERAMHNL